MEISGSALAGEQRTWETSRQILMVTTSKAWGQSSSLLPSSFISRLQFLVLDRHEVSFNDVLISSHAER